MYCHGDRYRSTSSFRKNSALCDGGIVESCVERIANMVFYFTKIVAVFGTEEPYIRLRTGKYMGAMKS